MKFGRKPILFVLIACVVIACMAGYVRFEPCRAMPERGVNEAALKEMILRRDTKGMREHAWRIWEEITRDCGNGTPRWMKWWPAQITLRARNEFARPGPDDGGIDIGFMKSKEFGTARGPKVWVDGKLTEQPEVISVFFSDAAHRFILKKGYDKEKTLHDLSSGMDKDRIPIEQRHIESFPERSASVKAAWVLFDGGANNSVYVWNPKSGVDPQRSWDRVKVCTTQRELDETRSKGEKGALISRFYSIPLNADRAKKMNETAGLDLQVEAGSVLLLVGLHVSVKDLEDWVWATFWWHDRPKCGEFAAQRPESIGEVWRNYLMDVSFDADVPNEIEPGISRLPNICFNPYLEGSLDDFTVSNCVACHQRASATWERSSASRTGVIRGRVPLDDASEFEERLRLDYVWSLSTDPRP